MAAIVRKFDWGATTLWILATAASWGVGIIPAMLIINDALMGGGDVVPDEVTIAIYAVGCLGGTAFAGGVSVGAGQCLVFKTYMPKQANSWLLASTVGGGIGWVLGWISSLMAASVIGLIAIQQHIYIPIDSTNAEAWILSAPIVGMVTGLAMGLAQWRVLRQFGIRSKRWKWVLASGLSWAIGVLAFWFVYNMVGGPFFTMTGNIPALSPSQYNNESTSWFQSMLVGWIAGGLVIGGLTGINMKRFLASADQSQQPTLGVVGINSAPSH